MLKEEFIDVIDQSGKKVRSASKSEIYAQKLPHAIVHVLIYNNAKQMACKVRSMRKDFCPGCISTSVGGHISAGESPLQAAKREMMEEIGITSEPIHLFSDWYEGKEKIRKILHVFIAEPAKKYILNKNEVERIEWYEHEELRKKPKKSIHPELAFILEKINNLKVYNKLVRDRIPRIIESKGAQPKTRKLKKAEFLHELKIKVIEEGHELLNAKTKRELEGELADLLELIDTLIFETKVDKKKLALIKKQKRKVRGGFDERIFLESVYEKN